MTFLTNSLQIKHIPGNSFIRLLLIVSFVLILSLSLISTSLAAGMPVTLGGGVDASSTILGPGFSATNTDSFTLRTGTTTSATSTVTQVLVTLKAGGENDGTIWATSTGAATSSVNNPWNSITYGNGLFVAVAATTTSQSVMTSPDGQNWTLRTATNTGATWNSITYGNGLFVAVGCAASCLGSANSVMTSPDGITWTPRSAPNINRWNSVVYGNGLFVAVGSAGGAQLVMTSVDGITWTGIVPGGGGGCIWASVTYGNGLFVATDQSGGVCANRIITSHNGSTWTARTP
jgi:hypothetical protein